MILYFADFTKNHVCQLVEMSLVWYLNEAFKLRWYCPINEPNFKKNTFQLTLVKIFDNRPTLFLKCPIYGVFTLRGATKIKGAKIFKFKCVYALRSGTGRDYYNYGP